MPSGWRQKGDARIVPRGLMTDRDEPAERTTHSLEETLALAPMEGTPLLSGMLARLDQGVTSTVRGMHTHAKAEEVRKEIGIPKERLAGWGRMSVAHQLDAIATWLLLTDQAQQTLAFQMKSDILGSHALRVLYRKEIPFDDGTIQWIFENLGHTSICWGASSPKAAFGANPQWINDQFARAAVERQMQESADHTRAAKATQIRSIRRARG